MQTQTAVVVLISGWSGYFALHSWLASLPAKRWFSRRWPRMARYYRLGYNALAILLILPLVALTLLEPSPWVWRWQGLGAWLANLAALAALAGFAWTTRYYSMAEFVGSRQVLADESRVEDQERFTISPLHRWVRHPWYTLGLVILWSRDMSLLLLVTAVMVTLYLFIGSRLEERKLIAYHGERYRRYRERVPGIIPLPWKHLSREEASRLVDGD